MAYVFRNDDERELITGLAERYGISVEQLLEEFMTMIDVAQLTISPEALVGLDKEQIANLFVERLFELMKTNPSIFNIGKA